ncbi:hypothetical protein PLICRDRAFT_173071 [Plicaturopsis crispa FD-325 SS-3]|nr:hypothetical protein PLICRDRAFT_173071 [Plicaturopsis crispa FD-325 SS-3]
MPIPQLSTAHRGVAFEQKCLQLLQQRMSMSLRRVGGKSDGGIDLQGWWWLPPLDRPSGERGADTGRRRLRVLAQCKAEKKKKGPNYVREMEGVLYRVSRRSEHRARSHTRDGPLVLERLGRLIRKRPALMHALLFAGAAT